MYLENMSIPVHSDGSCLRIQIKLIINVSEASSQFESMQIIDNLWKDIIFIDRTITEEEEMSVTNTI